MKVFNQSGAWVLSFFLSLGLFGSVYAYINRHAKQQHRAQTLETVEKSEEPLASSEKATEESTKEQPEKAEKAETVEKHETKKEETPEDPKPKTLEATKPHH